MDLGFASAPFISSPLVAPSAFFFSFFFLYIHFSLSLSLSLSFPSSYPTPLFHLFIHAYRYYIISKKMLRKKGGNAIENRQSFTNRLCGSRSKATIPMKGNENSEILLFDIIVPLYIFNIACLIFFFFQFLLGRKKGGKKRFTLVCRSMARGRTIHLGRGEQEARESVSRNGWHLR